MLFSVQTLVLFAADYITMLFWGKAILSATPLHEEQLAAQILFYTPCLWIVAVVQLKSCVQLFTTPWTAGCQASLSFTVSQSLLELMSIKSVMPSNHLILCHPLLLLPSIFTSIRVFCNESALHIR